MKILIVNTIDKGGAATACIRLHLGLLSEQVESKILLRNKFNNKLPQTFLFRSNKNVSDYDKIKNWILTKSMALFVDNVNLNTKLLKSIDKLRPRGLERISLPYSNFDITETELYKEADIINLHWVGDFLDYETFFKKNTKPVVWTLHDMNPVSSFYHYEEKYCGVDKYGSPIPISIGEEEKKISEQIYQKKLLWMSNQKDVVFIAPSQWIAESVKAKKIVGSDKIYHIPNGLSSEIFLPRNMTFARNLLGLPLDKKIFLFIAADVNHKRKGFDYLYQALNKVSSRNDIFCAILGKNNETNKEQYGYKNLGFIKDERLLSAAYSASDVFVIPSVIDNLPNTVIESLFCGCPIIGFPVGGIPEMIEDKKNGLLAKDLSVNSLVEVLLQFLSAKIDFNRIAISEEAKLKYSLEKQSKAYIEVFNSSLLKN